MSIKELEKNKYKIDVPIGYNGNKRIRHIETYLGTKKEAVVFDKLKVDQKITIL